MKTESMDKISELPEDMLQRILYFLPQNEAVRTCVLSKSWRYIWCARVNLEVSDTSFKGSKHDFLSSLDNTLRRYSDQRLCFKKFHLCISLDYLDHTSVSFLERWIPKLTNMGVKEFRLFIYSKNRSSRRRRTKLPSVVFEAECLQDLQVQKIMLDRRTINERTVVVSKHLKRLHLEQVNITDEILEKIISSCPLIETMFLKSCNRLRNIHANTLHRLKHFSFLSNPSSEEEDCNIKIYAPSIETIDISNSTVLFQKGADFRNLNSLSLRNVQFCLDHFSSCKFPSLEKLDLSFGYGYGLDESIEEPQLVIDAPNIKTFGYHGFWASLSPISISFAATSREWSSTLFLIMRYAPCLWLLKLHKLLESLSSRSETSLVIYQIHKNNEDIFQENLDLVQDLKDNYGNRPAVTLATLNLMVTPDVSYFLPLTNMLLCFCRPRIIVNINYLKSDPGSVLKSLTQGESGNYQDQLRQLWLPYLEEVGVEIYDENLGEYQPISLSDLPDEEQGKRISTRFVLKWRENLQHNQGLLDQSHEKGRRERRCFHVDGQDIGVATRHLAENTVFPPPKRSCPNLLSKSWRYVWCTRANLDFSDFSDTIFKGNKQDFLSTLDNTLQRYCDQRLCLEEFHLCISLDYLDHKSVSVLQRWMPKLTNMGVKEFRLFIYSKNRSKRRKRIKLPSVVFEAESLQDLQVQRLTFGRKTINERTVLPKHLKKLHLEEVNIDDVILQKIISSCPLIETMILESCNRLRNIPANTLRHLKHFTFSSRPSSEEDDCIIDTYAPSIETISIHNGTILFQKGADFRKLRSLYMSYDVMFSLDQFSSCKFPSLDNLAIIHSDGLEESVEESQLVVDAPNIKTFGYQGWFIPIFISFATTSKDWSSTLILLMTDAPSSWLLKVHKLLESLSRSEISLTIYQRHMNDEHIFQETNDLVLDIKDNCGNKPAIMLEKLKFMGAGDLSCFSHFSNRLFCICRPRSIDNINYTNSGTVFKSLMQRESGNECQLRQLWWPDLEEVSMEIYDKNRREYYPASLSDLPDYEEGKRISTRFLLKWRENL